MCGFVLIRETLSNGRPVTILILCKTLTSSWLLFLKLRSKTEPFYFYVTFGPFFSGKKRKLKISLSVQVRSVKFVFRGTKSSVFSSQPNQKLWSFMQYLHHLLTIQVLIQKLAIPDKTIFAFYVSQTKMNSKLYFTIISWMMYLQE